MKTAALLVLALSLAGCTGLQLYTVPPDVHDDLPPADRAQYRSSVRPCDDRLPEDDKDPRITALCEFAIIEFDDQGEFLYPDRPDRPGHLGAALDLVHRRTRPGVGDDPGQEALVVVFVHGWKNDASPRNEDHRNLASFKKALRDLTRAQLERCEVGDQPFCARPVVGIYMAWHGETFRTPLLKQLSYFSRRQVAEAVGRVSFSHALHRIVNHAKGSKSENDEGYRTRGNERSIVVVVGHSLGAVILENTLLRSLTMETNDFRADFPVDLAVAVNSANEAILTRQFIDALEKAPPAMHPATRLSLPLIVSVTSEGDWATGKLTPTSQRLRGFGQAFRPDDLPTGGTANGFDQAYFYRHTAGHSDPAAGLHSHRVVCPRSAKGCGEEPPSKRQARAEMRAEAEKGGQRRDLFDPPAIRTVDCPRPQEVDEHGEPLRCVESLWFTGTAPVEATGPELYQISRLPGSPNETPFWVVKLPKRIVPNHSFIFQSEFVSMLAALINIPGAHEVESSEQAVAWLLGGEEEAEGTLTLTSQ